MLYLFVALILIACSYFYMHIAKYVGIVDRPNHRSSHTQVTIRGGGILFYIALLIFFITSGFEYPYLFIGTTIIGIVSFIDDLSPLPPSVRLPIQFIAAAMVLYQVSIDYPVLSLIILLIVSVGFINAYNFMDGINALTGVYSIVILGFLYFFNTNEISFVNQDLLLYLLFSLIIFGYYNFRKKAIFFSGDVGSISIAVIMLFLIFKFYVTLDAPVALLLVAVYGVDSVLTIVRRIKMKEKISEAHRHHLYQIFVDSKEYSHIKTSLIYGATQLFCCVVVYYSYSLGMWIQIIITLIILFILSALYFLLVRHFKEIRLVIS